MANPARSLHSRVMALVLLAACAYSGDLQASCNNTATNQLAVQIVNDSGVADGSVNVLLSAHSTIGWPSGGAPSGLAYYDNDPTRPTVTAGALSGLASCGKVRSPYTGSMLSVYQFSVANITGGRLMVSYGQKVSINQGHFPTGTENFRWDKMEFAYPHSGADLTSMDFFSIPMQFEYLDASGDVLTTMTYYASTPTLLSALYNLNSGTMGSAFQPSTWTPTGTASFVRVTGPSLLASNSSTGSPAPYPSFGAYLQSLTTTPVQSFTVAGAGNAGCAAQVSYAYQGKVQAFNQNYILTLTPSSQMSGGTPCGVPPGAMTAQGTASIASGAVTAVVITNPGSDYFQGAPAVTFNNDGTDGTGAVATATLSPSGTVAAVNISNGGSGYTSPPKVTFSQPPTPPSTVNLPPNLAVTVNLPAPGQKRGYDVNLYGAPATSFSVQPPPGVTLTPTQLASIPNSLYAVIAGDFMAGMNFGYVGKGSNAPQNSASWYSNPPTLYPYGGARKTNDGFYNPYAAVFYNLSDAYGFAYSDRNGRPSPYVPLPSNATTMRVTLLNDTRLDTPIVTVSNPTPPDNTKLIIDWPRSSSATGYTVNVGYGGGTAPIQTINNCQKPCTISGLSPGTTYQISVTATGQNAGQSIQSYTVPVYATTTGTIASPSGPVTIGTGLNWNTSGLLTGYKIFINNTQYSPGGSNAQVSVSASSTLSTPGLNVYGLAVTNASNSTVYRGNYVVDLRKNSLGNYLIYNAFLNPPNSMSLTSAWYVPPPPPPPPPASAPPYPGGPISRDHISTVVIGTPFAPLPDKRASTVCFPGVSPCI